MAWPPDIPAVFQEASKVPNVTLQWAQNHQDHQIKVSCCTVWKLTTNRGLLANWSFTPTLKQHGNFISRATCSTITFSLEPSSPTVLHKVCRGEPSPAMESTSHPPATFNGHRSNWARLHLPCLAGKEAKQQHKTQCDWNDKDQELPRKGNISEALQYAPYRKLFLFPIRVWAECNRCRVTAPVERWWDLAGWVTPGSPAEGRNIPGEQQTLCLPGNEVRATAH